VKKNYSKTVISVFTLVVLLGIGGLVAYASTVYSNWSYIGPVNGYYYQDRSWATKVSSGVHGGAVLEPQWDGSAPAGYMALNTKLINGDGYLINQSGWYINEDVSYGIIQLTSSCTTSGIYHGMGEVGVYNGSTYTHYYTNNSPNVIWP